MIEIVTSAPIVPNSGLGGLHLRQPIISLDSLLLAQMHQKHLPLQEWATFHNWYTAVFSLSSIRIKVDIRNGKICELCACVGYEGKLFDNLIVGFEAAEALKLHPSLQYDEATEAFIFPDIPGVELRTSATGEDPPEEWVAASTISEIAVYADEWLHTQEGQRYGRW